MNKEKPNRTMVDQCFFNLEQFILLQCEQEKTNRKMFSLQAQITEKLMHGNRLSDRLPSFASAINRQDRYIEKKANAETAKHSLKADQVKRFVVNAVTADLDKAANQLSLPAGKAILVLEKHPPSLNLIERVLSGLPNPVYHISAAKQFREIGNNCIQIDFSSPGQIQQLRDRMMAKAGGVCAIFNLIALTTAIQGDRLTDPLMTSDPDAAFATPANRYINTMDEEGLQESKDLFLLLKIFLADLKTSARSAGAWFVNLSFMDGRFGLGRKQTFALGQAGSIGLAKAIARENPRIRIKCIDINPSVSAVYLITRLKQELSAGDDVVEVGLDGANRWKPDIVETSVFDTLKNSTDLDSDSVVLITGGAYGIVAEIAKAVARRYHCRLITVGRSAYPDPETGATRQLTTPRQLRDYLILQNKTAKHPMAPAQILELEKKILKDRQIHSNYTALKENCAGIEYHSIDIRDADRFSHLIDRIYHKYGRLDGVIHGAGVIDDKPVERKSVESFDRVFDTKVIPAMVLSRKLRPGGLKFMCFFSSVAARFGNRGQTDYCAANEFLNKLAQRLDAQWDARVFAINWGPWDAGMVGADLREALTKRGFSLIPINEGVRFFIDELERSTETAPEVLITGKLQP